MTDVQHVRAVAGEVLWADAHVAFLAFYDLVVAKDADPLAAVAVMNAATGLPAGSFQAVDGASRRASQDLSQGSPPHGGRRLPQYRSPQVGDQSLA
jgi:hypothetical protein